MTNRIAARLSQSVVDTRYVWWYPDSALISCSLRYFVCDLKATQMNEQRCQVQNLLYKFKLVPNAVEATKKCLL